MLYGERRTRYDSPQYKAILHMHTALYGIEKENGFEWIGRKCLFSYKLIAKNVFCEPIREKKKTIETCSPFHPFFYSPSHLVKATSQYSCNIWRRALTALYYVHELTDTHFSTITLTDREEKTNYALSGPVNFIHKIYIV